jgi:hypothetical protein
LAVVANELQSANLLLLLRAAQKSDKQRIDRLLQRREDWKKSALPNSHLSGVFVASQITNTDTAMICSSCRRSFLTRLRSLQIQPAPSRASPSTATSSRRRYASTVPATPNAAPAQAPPSIAIDGGAANPAQSSNTAGLSQPLSEPHTPSTSTAKKSGGDGAASPTKVKSSVPGGTELRGLGFTKAQPKVIAKEDDEYPDWLWTLLDRKNVASGETKADLSGMHTMREGVVLSCSLFPTWH